MSERPKVCRQLEYSMEEELRDHFPELESYYLNEESSDLIIRVQNQRLFAHKFVLLAKSQIFRRYFKTYKNDKEIKIRPNLTYSVEAIKLMLKFLYFEKLNFTDIHEDYRLLKQVFNLAQKFQLIRLETSIKRFIGDKLLEYELNPSLDEFKFAEQMDLTQRLQQLFQRINFDNFDIYLFFAFNNSLDLMLIKCISFIESEVDVTDEWFCRKSIDVIKLVLMLSEGLRQKIAKAIDNLSRFHSIKEIMEIKKFIDLDSIKDIKVLAKFKHIFKPETLLIAFEKNRNIDK
jgi:hypothetical protein